MDLRVEICIAFVQKQCCLLELASLKKERKMNKHGSSAQRSFALDFLQRWILATIRILLVVKTLKEEG